MNYLSVVLRSVEPFDSRLVVFEVYVYTDNWIEVSMDGVMFKSYKSQSKVPV